MFSPFLALFVLSAFLLVENVSSLANLWEVTHPERPGAKPSYFYGTLHVTWKLIFSKVPPELRRLVQSADVAVFESDFTSATEHKELRECVEKRYQCLGLDRELEQRLEKVFGFLDVEWWKIAPDWLVLKLFSIIAQRHQKKAANWVQRHFYTFLDHKLLLLVKKGKKELRFAERRRDLCELDPSMDRQRASILLTDALDEYEKCRAKGINLVKKCIELYKNSQMGRADFVEMDLCGMGRTQAQKLALKEASQPLNRNLLVGRNEKWAPKMDEWMRKDPHKTFAFFFGVAHFNSDRYTNLVQMLTDKGYRIRKIDAIVGGSKTSIGGSRSDQPADDDDGDDDPPSSDTFSLPVPM